MYAGVLEGMRECEEEGITYCEYELTEIRILNPDLAISRGVGCAYSSEGELLDKYK